MMTAKEWVEANLNVMKENGTEIIDWGTGVYTQVDIFLSFFGTAIEESLSDNKDVKQGIRDNDNGKGYAKLI